MARRFAFVLALSVRGDALRVPRPSLRPLRQARAMKAPHVPIPYALRTSHAALYATDAAAAAVEPEPEPRGLKAILASPETKKVISPRSSSSVFYLTIRSSEIRRTFSW